MQKKREPMRLRVLTLGFAVLALACAPRLAMAQAEVDVNSGAVQPLPIAIPGFGGPSAGADVSRVVAQDLERSGLFRPLDPATFPERALDINVEPKLDAWKGAGAQALVNGQASVTGDGRLKVDFRLWDIGTQQQLIGSEFTATQDNWRRVAHKIADQVYEKLTGEKGYFDTRVVFVAESGPKIKRVKRLAIMDQDGANPQYLTDGSYIVMSPRFSSTSQEITYTAIRPTGSSVYVLNIENGRQETVGHFPGMVMSSRFAPDGSKLAFAVESHGNIDIYVEDLRSRDASAGETQIFALSLMAAVAASAPAFPLVMDTPFARLDPRHRRNVLRHFAQLGPQLVLLAHPAELSDVDLAHLGDAVAPAIELVAEAVGEARQSRVRTPEVLSRGA